MKATWTLAVCLLGVCMSSRRASAADENASIRRLQFRVKTCDKKDSATNDPVKVSVRSGHSSYLNYPHNDFTRKSDFTYDLIKYYSDFTITNGQYKVTSGAIGRIADIHRIRLSKTGEDGVCIKAFWLLVNEAVIFEKTYTNGKWLDDNGGSSHLSLEINSSTLRASASWQSWTMDESYGLRIPAEWMRGEVIANVAKVITGDENPAYWRGNQGVIVRRGTTSNTHDENHIHVQVNLRVDTTLWPDRDVTLHFDIKLSKKPKGAKEAVPAFEVVNYQGFADPTWAAWVPVLNIVDAFLHTLTTIVINQNAPGGSGNPGVPLCPIADGDDGAIEFRLCSNAAV